jgi:hypothetical protein
MADRFYRLAGWQEKTEDFMHFVLRLTKRGNAMADAFAMFNVLALAVLSLLSTKRRFKNERLT